MHIGKEIPFDVLLLGENVLPQQPNFSSDDDSVEDYIDDDIDDEEEETEQISDLNKTSNEESGNNMNCYIFFKISLKFLIFNRSNILIVK